MKRKYEKLLINPLEINRIMKDMQLNMDKKHYDRLSIEAMPYEMARAILSGSVTEQSVAAGNVSVQDYSYGFSTDSGITDSGFDVKFE